MQKTAERNESLWWLSVSPAIWMSHLLVVYGTTAVLCAKAASLRGPMPVIQWTTGVATALALAAVLATGLRGLRRHRYRHGKLPHDADTADDRLRFLGFATLLLSGLSAVGIVFVALPALFIESCR